MPEPDDPMTLTAEDLENDPVLRAKLTELLASVHVDAQCGLSINVHGHAADHPGAVYRPCIALHGHNGKHVTGA